MKAKTALFVLLVVLRGISGAQTGLPEGIVNTQNPKDVPLTPRESLRLIDVPDGFHVTLFAGEPDVCQPIAMTFDDRGRLWVAENYSHPKWQPTGKDRILIFEDKDNDGRFDTRKVFWDKGNYLTGLLLGHGGVWICNTPALRFIPDRDGDDIPDGEPIDVLDGWVRQNRNNVVNNLIWGPDGWLYGCIGNAAASMVGKPGAPESERTKISRGTWRYHPTRDEFEVFTRGCVNPWGLDFNDHGEAFSTNCVLAHLWHCIPGAHFERRSGEGDHPYVYSRMPPTCDHLHWGGGDWTSSRSGTGKHSVAGGGHAHTGAMIYLGDNWPDKYRDTFFTANIHGNRINNDILHRHGSGYVGKHGNDFLFGNNPWFRCLSQKYGPDGAVFFSDWHDLGECHDNDGSHRSSGRIYKVAYGKPRAPKHDDLKELSNAELVELQLDKNDWYVRQSRRILHERANAGKDLTNAHKQLQDIFANNADVTRKLRALWTLYVTSGAKDPFFEQQLNHENEHVRCWAIRLIADDKVIRESAHKKLVSLAENDASQMVRVYLASALQRMPLEQRMDVALKLVAHSKDAEDANLPHMIWYGIEPIVKSDLDGLSELIFATKIPLVRQHIARRAVAGD